MSRNLPFLALALVLVPAPAASQDAAALLPEGTLIHVTLDGRPCGRDGSGLALARVAREPEVQAFLKGVRGWVALGRMTVGGMLEGMADLTLDEAFELLQGPGSVSVTGIARITYEENGIEYSELAPEVIATWALGAKGSKAESLIRYAKRQYGDEGLAVEELEIAGGKAAKVRLPGVHMPFFYAMRQELLVLTNTQEALEAVLLRQRRGDPAGSLAASPRFRKVQARVRRAGTVLGAYVDVGALIRLLEPEVPMEVGRVLDATGLRKLEAAGLGIELDGRGVRDRCFLLWPGEDAPLKALVPRGKGLAAPRILPAETVAYCGVALDWEKLYGLARGLLEDLDPWSVRGLDRALARARERTGVDVAGELLPALGSEVGLWVAWPGQSVVPHVGLLVELEDRQRFENLCSRTSHRFAGLATVRRLDFRGHTVHYVVPHADRFRHGVPGVSWLPGPILPAPAWTYVDDHLVVTLTPHACKALIAGLVAGTPRLADREDFRAGLGHLAADHEGARWKQLCFVDLGRIAAFLLDNGAPLLQSLVPESIRMTVPLNPAAFPSTDVLTRHVFPLVGAGTVSDEGLSFEGRSPAGVVLPSAAAATGLATAARLVWGGRMTASAVRTRPRPAAPPEPPAPAATRPAVEETEVQPPRAPRRRAEHDLRLLKEAVFAFLLVEDRLPAPEEWPRVLLEGTARSGSPYLDAGAFPGGRVVDPWGRPYLYQRIDARSFVIASYGRDGRPGGSGEDADVETGRRP